MQLAFPSAFKPFMTDEIVLLSMRPGETETFRLSATVVAGNPVEGSSGEAAACSQYSVSVAAADLAAAKSIVQGSRISADPGGRWPELTVQRVYSQAGLIHFDCSANERGGRS